MACMLLGVVGVYMSSAGMRYEEDSEFMQFVIGVIAEAQGEE